MLEYKLFRGRLSQAIEDEFREIGYLAYTESVFCDLIGFDAEKLVATAQSYAVQGSKVLFVCRDGARVAGIFAGYYKPWYFSDESIARDVLWYVREEYRDAGVGIVLLSMFEQWAGDCGAKAIWLGQDSGIDTDKFSGVLKKRGYSFIGSNYSLKVGK